MRSLVGGILALSLGLAGCGTGPNVNLADARSLGTAASAARDSYAALASDFEGSCERQYRWNYLTSAELAHLANAKTAAANAAVITRQLNDLSAKIAEKAQAKDVASIKVLVAQIETTLPKAGTAISGPAPDICGTAPVTGAVAAWNTWNGILLGFFTAIGNVAVAPATDAFGFSAAATNVANAEKSDPKIGTQATAVAGVLNAVFGEAIAAKQSKAIATYTTGDVAKVTDALVDALTAIAQDDYVDVQLAGEEGALDRFYSINLPLCPRANRSSDRYRRSSEIGIVNSLILPPSEPPRRRMSHRSNH